MNKTSLIIPTETSSCDYSHSVQKTIFPQLWWERNCGC